MEIPFLKMHGLGNDYVYLDLVAHPELGDLDFAAFSREASDRHLGIGGDGVILILPGRDGTDLGMRIFNADGSEGEMCGNGIRCLMRYAAQRGYAGAHQTVATGAGPMRGEVLADGRVRVDMGAPRLELASIGFTGPGAMRDRPLDIGGERLLATAVGLGNPHVVCFPEGARDLGELALRLGPVLERADFAPHRTNVEFARPLGPRRIAMEVWERGSGRTQACGTGACATLVAAALTGRSGREADVVLRGGLLRVAWTEDDRVLMTGPAELSFWGSCSWPRGEVEASW